MCVLKKFKTTRFSVEAVFQSVFLSVYLVFNFDLLVQLFQCFCHVLLCCCSILYNLNVKHTILCQN